ncbi:MULTISPECIES: chain length determinant protein tyrosine kinase EpsG [unclassified Methylophilus]|uniref:chain length determinant protein tyrosine kinase EpsG n=1 Tax=unclassified Methylophilus TaxID=2630143 RepID=UPI0023B2CD77|nr:MULTISPECIES: chain length determinant protein tyrosine kinase EpsG [unclassified Methylophilus]MDF0376796.1 chain length determinant protein tyrosine kinase EpsG [Methylophilus sp. YYY-1]MDT7850695.1 chain length determinant protein tyrosine kinase EpsG [Methylophilus sp. VKM B-3414]
MNIIETDNKSTLKTVSSSIGHLLLDMGKITDKDAERILKFQKEKAMRFGEAAMALGFVTMEDINQALSYQFDYPYLTPDKASFNSGLIAAFDPFSKEVESLRSLRTQLILRWFERGFKSIAISSATEEDGASLLAANLAIVFSQLGERTLLIDANLRQPTQHKLFRLSNNQGLSDILVGRASTDVVVRIPSLLNLSILSAGATPPNPQELLNKEALDDLLKVFAEHYDVIILNTSPILASSDAQIVAKKVGGVLISTLQNKTALKDTQEAYEECRSLGIDVQIALNAG